MRTLTLLARAVTSITGCDSSSWYNYKKLTNQKYSRLGGRYLMMKLLTKLTFAIVSGVVVAAAAAQVLHLAA